ncbi:hypothetical protein SIN8267_00101 [Sinobacterium norvegicum]|uniref:Uncharacterized protein n=1 Tax=Sinobacterium norvegicum TaxID=1641715 RepID=A0ABM9A9Y8_9GAMM|nr:hypothetical protein [Sinobacterium norvegicum]CAH0990018.1 hypothetical protein SIN8267_00101 [Sinobacterium norvegicum]
MTGPTSDTQKTEATIPSIDITDYVAPSGFWYQWGTQAWLDMLMSKSMIVKQAHPIITHTFLPILRLSDDPETIDAGWAQIKTKREIIRWSDSPREKWRKSYGNFVREAEWALLELRKHFSQKQYEEIVVGTSVSLSHENSGKFLDMMNSMSDKSKAKAKKKPKDPNKQSAIEKFLFNNFNPGGFLTGPAVITKADIAGGEMIMTIPDCGWHSCGKQADLPNPNALPEEGCLLICKGAFEALFNGHNGGLKMEFDPHLPETSCTVRMSWDTGQ